MANPPIEQSGNVVTVGKHTSYHNVSIDYEITTPKGTSLEASSGSGDLRISDLGGSLKAGTGSGSIEANGLSGRVTLETGSGDIRAEMHAAPDVKAQTGSGSIRLRGVTGGFIRRDRFRRCRDRWPTGVELESRDGIGIGNLEYGQRG